MKNLPKINEVLAYKNQLVIKRFQNNYPDYAEHAESLFTEMLRYLWLCEKHDSDARNHPNNSSLDFIPVMHEEMRMIDNIWHEFILITRDYHDFCHHYFGHFIHHQPNMIEELDYSEEQFLDSLNLFLNYVYDVLGEKTLKNWFSEHLDEVA